MRSSILILFSFSSKSSLLSKISRFLSSNSRLFFILSLLFSFIILLSIPFSFFFSFYSFLFYFFMIINFIHFLIIICNSIFSSIFNFSFNYLSHRICSSFDNYFHLEILCKFVFLLMRYIRYLISILIIFVISFIRDYSISRILVISEFVEYN